MQVFTPLYVGASSTVTFLEKYILLIRIFCVLRLFLFGAKHCYLFGKSLSKVLEQNKVMTHDYPWWGCETSRSEVCPLSHEISHLTLNHISHFVISIVYLWPRTTFYWIHIFISSWLFTIFRLTLHTIFAREIRKELIASLLNDIATLIPSIIHIDH